MHNKLLFTFVIFGLLVLVTANGAIECATDYCILPTGKVVLEEGDTLKTESLEVKVLYIQNNEAVFMINNHTTTRLSKGDLDILPDGTVIIVAKILENEAGDKPKDSVRFYLTKKRPQERVRIYPMYLNQ